jgi:hypothetical protein
MVISHRTIAATVPTGTAPQKVVSSCFLLALTGFFLK